MDKRCPCYQGISQGHSPLLAKLYRLLYDSLRYREDDRRGKEFLEKTLVRLREIMVAEYFNIAHG